MTSQASLLNEKFKVNIRRRHRQNIIKEKRQVINAQQMLDQQKSESQQTMLPIKPVAQIEANWQFKNIQQLYQIFIKFDNFMDQVSEQQLSIALQFIITQESLQTIQGIQLVGAFIQFCGSQNKKNERKKNYIRHTLQTSKIQQQIFSLAQKSFNQLNKKMLLVCLLCVKNMALIRMEGIRSKNLLQRYCSMIEQLISEPSILILISFASQIHVLKPDLVKLICEQAASNEKNIRIYTLSIINNYLALEQNQQIIQSLFIQLGQTLVHLYMNCKSAGAKFGNIALVSLKSLLSLYPDNYGKQLLLKVKRIKLHQVVLIILKLSSDETKLSVFQLEQYLIEKTIRQLGQQFFNLFCHQIIDQIFLGIQCTNVQIISRCIKIIALLIQYSPPQIINKFQSEHDLSYVLEELTYHKNQYISTLAEHLQKQITAVLDNTGMHEMNDQ